jgi:hypothetical protein
VAPNSKFRGLSVEGGGIRGIIPCRLLGELEKQTGKLVRDCFDYFAGTSTGSDLCALIQAGVPMSTALEFYTGEDAKQVFCPQSPIEQWPKRAVDGYMFDARVLAKCLTAALGPNAFWRINDCPKGILIVACDSAGHTWFFTKDNRDCNSCTTGKCPLVDAVVASSAAPTYFDWWDVFVPALTRTLKMADGGTTGFANPVHRMAIEMFEFDQFAAADTWIYSLGCGYYVPPPNAIAPKSLLDRIGFATGSLVDSAENLADQDTRREYFRDRPGQFQKFSPALPSAIDEADLSAVPVLLALAEKMAAGMDWIKILG